MVIFFKELHKSVIVCFYSKWFKVKIIKCFWLCPLSLWSRRKNTVKHFTCWWIWLHVDPHKNINNHSDSCWDWVCETKWSPQLVLGGHLVDEKRKCILTQPCPIIKHLKMVIIVVTYLWIFRMTDERMQNSHLQLILLISFTCLAGFDQTQFCKDLSVRLHLFR